MKLTPFFLALSVRSLSLLFPQTFFQPDEFYQSLEPAHNLAFGYGFLTWEWKDLPVNASDGRLGSIISGGILRSWVWPGLFATIFKALELLKLDDTFLLTFLPRVLGVLIAALTDFATYRLSSKLLGNGSSAGALFLSLTSLFHAHALPRALSTSAETLLVTLALLYFPFPTLIAPKTIIVGEKGLAASHSMKDVSKASDYTIKEARDAGAEETISYSDITELNYVVMDRVTSGLSDNDYDIRSLPLSVALATLAISIRPTSLPLWTYLDIDLVGRKYQLEGISAVLSTVFTALVTSISVLVTTTGLDFAITGRFSFPIATFFHQNVVRNISAFYGSTNPCYHLTQSLPILLFPIWWWWVQGFASCVLPQQILPTRLASLDRPPAMVTLARAIAFTIAALSFSPHSEWRFLHFLLAPLLLFTLAPLNRAYMPTIIGAYRLTDSVRQYTRIPKRPYYLCLLAPILPWLYLNMFHGRAQVDVIAQLRSFDRPSVTGVAALMPCHSTPWMSHLHMDIPAWFLTCEPPLSSDDSFEHKTQQDLFYESPTSYLQHVFPYVPVPLHEVTSTHPHGELPSHLLLFGSLLDATDSTAPGDGKTVREALNDLDYKEVWRGWNGFDIVQDDPRRAGGVRIWQKTQGKAI